MAATCQIEHLPGSKTERMCPTHGLAARRAEPAQSVVTALPVPSPHLMAVPGDSESHHRAMMAANGSISAEASMAGLLPICDRDVALRRGGVGEWAVALSAVGSPADILEHGFGRTPGEAYHQALASRDGGDAQQGYVLVRIDRWDDAGTSANGEIRAVPMPLDEGPEEDQVAAAIAHIEAHARTGVSEHRAWICTPAGVSEV